MSASLDALLDLLFEELRARGFFAARAVACCQSCALEEMPDGRKFAYTHDQDEDGLRERGVVRVGFGGPAAGAEVAAVARALGIAVEWDGSDRSRPALSLPKPKEG